MEFLRSRKEKLNGFNLITQPYWYHVDRSKRCGDDLFGSYLIGHVDQLLAAFEAGNLFDWLRQEEEPTDQSMVTS